MKKFSLFHGLMVMFVGVALLLGANSCKKENVSGELCAVMPEFANSGQKAYLDLEQYSCFIDGETMRVNNSTGTISPISGTYDRKCAISGVKIPSSSPKKYYAFYPEHFLTGNKNLSSGFNGKTVYFPRTQDFVFENNRQTIQNPMVAEADYVEEGTTWLHFRNLCALLKVSIHTLESYDSIQVVFPTGTKVWGNGTINSSTYTVDMTDEGDRNVIGLRFDSPQPGSAGGRSYYIMIPKAVVPAGTVQMKVFYNKNNTHKVTTFTMTLQNEATLAENRIHTLGNFSVDLGLFSVSPTLKVVFSPGNLQWAYKPMPGMPTYEHSTATAGTNDYKLGTWSFAESQYEIIGAGNVNASSTYSGGIDLFGWGTSGYNGTLPYDLNSFYTGSSDITHAANNEYYDWGMFNSIYNPKTGVTDLYGSWRTLTIDEWDYVINKRGGNLDQWELAWWRFNMLSVVNDNDHSDILFRGLLLYPDGVTSQPPCITYDDYNKSWYKNTTNPITITKSEFDALDALGCAFLPSAGQALKPANGEFEHSGHNLGNYWSATKGLSDKAYYMKFQDTGGPIFTTTNSNDRKLGFSVRLVQDVHMGN